jgi:hypothetical protein
MASMSPSLAPTTRAAIRRGVGGLAAAVLLTATVTACGNDATPSGSGGASHSASTGSAQTLAVHITGDTVTPTAQEVNLAVGESLTITVQSDRAGELHVHSDPEHTFDFKPGAHTFKVTLDTPGSVDIEEHVSDTLVARVLVR